jgi:hypothetical protein
LKKQGLLPLFFQDSKDYDLILPGAKVNLILGKGLSVIRDVADGVVYTAKALQF